MTKLDVKLGTVRINNISGFTFSGFTSLNFIISFGNFIKFKIYIYFKFF